MPSTTQKAKSSAASKSQSKPLKSTPPSADLIVGAATSPDVASKPNGKGRRPGRGQAASIAPKAAIAPEDGRNRVVKESAIRDGHMLDGGFLDFPQDGRTPDITRITGPALQKAIASANEVLVNLYITAGRLKDSEPLAAELLGCSNAVLEVFARHGAEARYLLPDALGMPLAQLRLKDASDLESILVDRKKQGAAAQLLLRQMPRAVIEKALDSRRGSVKGGG